MKRRRRKDYTVQIFVDGRPRYYDLHIPPGYKGESRPVVIVLHGAMGNAWSARRATGMSRRADMDNFFAVYPYGTGPANRHLLTWNAGNCCGTAKLEKVDDVAFINALIDDLKLQVNIDERRIYVTGISNGGMLAHKLGRQLSDRLAAIAPVQSCIFETDITSKCCPVSVLMFHGTADRVIPFGGGKGSWYGYKLDCPPLEDTVQFWISNNECKKVPDRLETDSVIKETYRDGKDGTEVCLYTLQGGDHAWPGGRSINPLIAKPFMKVSATDLMCEFFWDHPKQAVQP